MLKYRLVDNFLKFARRLMRIEDTKEDVDSPIIPLEFDEAVLSYLESNKYDIQKAKLCLLSSLSAGVGNYIEKNKSVCECWVIYDKFILNDG